MRSRKYDFALIVFSYLVFSVVPGFCCSIPATASSSRSDVLDQVLGIAVATIPFGLLSLVLLTQEQSHAEAFEPRINRIIKWMVAAFFMAVSVVAIISYLERCWQYQQGLLDLGSMSGGDLMFFLWIAGFSFGLLVLVAARSFIKRRAY